MTGERDILGHLQAAAHELIEAARGALDAADELVSDRIRLVTMLLGPHADAPESSRVERIELEEPS